MNGTKLIKLQAGAFRCPVAAPKNFHQTLVLEDICIWFVTSFCVFISSKRIRVLALMNGTKLIKAGFPKLLGRTTVILWFGKISESGSSYGSPSPIKEYVHSH